MLMGLESDYEVLLLLLYDDDRIIKTKKAVPSYRYPIALYKYSSRSIAHGAGMIKSIVHRGLLCYAALHCCTAVVRNKI